MSLLFTAALATSALTGAVVAEAPPTPQAPVLEQSVAETASVKSVNRGLSPWAYSYSANTIQHNVVVQHDYLSFDNKQATWSLYDIYNIGAGPKASGSKTLYRVVPGIWETDVVTTNVSSLPAGYYVIFYNSPGLVERSIQFQKLSSGAITNIVITN